MAKGGSTRSGPAPDPNALRRDRKSDGEWLLLPAEGRTGSTPDWPMGDASPREKVIWARLWRKPQAVAWEKFGLEDQVALYTRRWVEAETPLSSTSLSTLVRQLADGLGLTMPGMNSLRWKIATDEVAPRRSTTTVRRPSSRDRFKVVSDGAPDFPTLGFLVSDWKTAHCSIPDGFQKGEPFVETDWQLDATVNHYRLHPTATLGQLATAFTNRRTQIILPQKSGKGPWSASDSLVQAVGPALFAGWALGGEVWDCRDYGCGCGFDYEYEPGEPMGQPWPTPLIQVTAFSEDQADNIWRPLQAMVKDGPLLERMRVGEEFIRIGGDGRIDKVTSSARSRLGAPITAAYQDETGLWTKSTGMISVAETQRRGLAGMGGRAVETTNAYDPAENSVAQRTQESKSKDIYRLFPQAPERLSFGDKRQRRQILRLVYAGVPWVDLDAIEAEALELMETDRAQAERFFGNRLVATADAWWDEKLIARWITLGDPVPVPAKTRIVLGFDGSQYDDWTAIRGRAWIDGRLYAFTPTYADGAPTWWSPVEHGGEVPRHEVQAAVEELFDRYDVARMYCDPELWQSEIDAWSTRYGEKRVVVWPTYRAKPMAAALERLQVDTSQDGYTHDGDDTMLTHIRNARRTRRPGGVVIGKPTQHQKIDLVMADALAHEAAFDVPPPVRRGMTVLR